MGLDFKGDAEGPSPPSGHDIFKGPAFLFRKPKVVVRVNPNAPLASKAILGSGDHLVSSIFCAENSLYNCTRNYVLPMTS
jgi:hypothetical protein